MQAVISIDQLVISRMVVPDLCNSLQTSLNDAEINCYSFVCMYILPSISKGFTLVSVIRVDFSNADSAPTAIPFNNFSFTCALIEVGSNATTTFSVRYGNLTTNSLISNCQQNTYSLLEG